MNDNIAIVKRFNRAAEMRDLETISTLLHPEYTLRDPLMTLKSPQEFLDFMKECPVTCKLENVRFIAQDDTVVQTLDALMIDPVHHRLRMCDVLTIKDGKVRSEEVFYDTADIPDEVRQMGQKSGKKAA